MTWPTSVQGTASALRTKHPRWIDANGLDQAATLHPLYSVARELLTKANQWLLLGVEQPEPFADMISPEWRALDGCALELGCECQVAYKIADTIGPKPSRFHEITTYHESDQFHDDTILWWIEPWAQSSKAQRALKVRAALGHPRAVAALQAQSSSLAGRARLDHRHLIGQVQRLWRDCECLPTGHLCDHHAAALRADPDDAEGWVPYSRRSGLLAPRHLCTAVHTNRSRDEARMAEMSKTPTEPPPLTPEEARTKTTKAQRYLTQLDEVLHELHEGQAHKALNYGTWAKYVQAEFDGMTVSRSYQLIRYAKKKAKIEAATGVENALTENESRALPEEKIEDVNARANEKIENGTPGPQAVKEAAAEVKAESTATRPAPEPESATSTAQVSTPTELTGESSNKPPMSTLLTAIADVMYDSEVARHDLAAAEEDHTIPDAWYAEYEALVLKCPNSAALALKEENDERLARELRLRFGTSRQQRSA